MSNNPRRPMLSALGPLRLFLAELSAAIALHRILERRGITSSRRRSKATPQWSLSYSEPGIGAEHHEAFLTLSRSACVSLSGGGAAPAISSSPGCREPAGSMK